MGDVCAISGCMYQTPATPPVPQPCLQVKWSLAALRVKICGQPALVDTSIGLCMGNVPAPPQVRITQLHVRGI